MKRYFQHSALLTLSIIIGILKPTYGFSECPSSGVTDPSIPGVSDCPSWIAYLKSTGQNLEAWCGNSANYKKCCLTCQNLGTRGDCTDVADSADCRIKQSQGLCTAQSDAGITVRIYCQKTCNICPATFSGLDLSCNTKICNSGTCQAANYFNVASVKCSCPTGTAGTYCQRQNSCSLSPCLNGGVCSSVNDEDILYTCTCLSGFSGKNCQTGCLPVSGCLTFVCQNGGQCRLNSANQPECVCLNGFLGVNCEILPCQNPCFNNPCMNGGTCQNSGTTYTCSCTQGFTGANCQGITNSQACGYNQCKNGASCYETSQTTYGCACPGGFYGTFCESTAIGPINTNSCQNNPCLNGGTCQTVGISGYICLCPAGTSGTNCASTGTVTSRPCSSNQCKNGATCYDTSFTQYGCACVIGFFGTYCDQQQTDLGGCSTNPCFNGGTCQSLGTSGSYICLCASGYTGLTCQGLAGSACNSNQCRNGATCYASSATTYSCACLINFYGTYCENSKQLCQTNSCKNGATCKDIGNSDFICICPVGFSGLYCESSSTVRPNNLVTVSVVTRSVSDKCASNLCKNGATCYETLVGEYGCACLGGFYGRYCENILTASPVSSCINNPCLNGSTCQSINSTSFKCLCATGMTGKNCETNMNLCKAGYCLNGGTCYIISMNQTACSCSAGFEGVNCQTAFVDTVKTTSFDLCNPNPCMNGGVCQANNSIGSASCNCLPGYFGNRCDQTNICFSEPCQNGGSCIPNGITGYTCTCTSLFAGDNCQSASCKSTPCQNGGLCLITGNLPYCKCLPGFTGKSCEFPSTCDTMKCKNGGTCISDNNNHVECRCPKSFYGQYCENQITEEVCKIGDRNKIDCQIWEFYGFCSFAYTYNAVPVPIYCPISCKLCTDANVCADTQTNCGIWKTLGLCDNVNQIDVNACRKSCGYCS